MTVFGEQILSKFSKRYAPARKSLGRFLELTREAEWKQMPDVNVTFPSTDFDSAAQLYIFDIGGNKHRLTASITFETQSVLIESVMTHEEYDRKG